METEGTSSQGSASGSLPSGQKRSRSSRYGMYEDIEEIMFGFGDGWPPEADTVELVEKMAVQYIRDLCVRSLQVASITGKLDKECFLYQVRPAPCAAAVRRGVPSCLPGGPCAAFADS